MNNEQDEFETILIMAGGTGGHIFPALSLAEMLKEHGFNVVWLGTRGRLEEQVVPQAGIPIHYIKAQGLRRTGILNKLWAPWQLLRATYQSIRIIQCIKADLVIGMGGYVSGSGGLAAWLCRKPLWIHEQNAAMGLTNRILARFAKQVFTAFPLIKYNSPAAQVIGNPVRQSIMTMNPSVKTHCHTPLRLLVLGGSLGALAINQTVPNILAELPESLRPEVWHQCGAQHIDVTQQAYQAVNVSAKLQPFIDNVAEAYAWADCVICRAGALTVSELLTAAVPAVLIPYPYAVDDHQYYNAMVLTECGGSVIIKQNQHFHAKLKAVLLSFCQQPEVLLTMQQAILAKQPQDATRYIVDKVLQAFNRPNEQKQLIDEAIEETEHV